VVVPVVVATRAPRVLLLWLVAQAVRVVVVTVEHLLPMDQHAPPRVKVEMVLQTLVVAVVAAAIAVLETVVVVQEDQELLWCVMHCQVCRRQTLIPPTTLVR
jgi:hypothetical protein